jgi:hypothetical protein
MSKILLSMLSVMSKILLSTYMFVRAVIAVGIGLGYRLDDWDSRVQFVVLLFMRVM